MNVSIRLLSLGVLSLCVWSQTSYMPLREVKAGMRGKGYTVFTGERVDPFDVEILGILENAGPRQSVILARLSGGPLQHTGVMQGMSGSPVYINGRLIGAVALAFAFSKDPIAGIRPFEEMIAPKAVTRAESAPAALPSPANRRRRSPPMSSPRHLPGAAPNCPTSPHPYPSADSRPPPSEPSLRNCARSVSNRRRVSPEAAEPACRQATLPPSSPVR